MSDLVEEIRAELARAAREPVPPSPSVLTRTAVDRARRTRVRRGTAAAILSAGLVAAVAVPAATRGGASPQEPTGPAAGPSSSASPTGAAPRWRVTERCSGARSCSALDVEAIAVGPATYRLSTAGEQPLSAGNLSIRLSVGGGKPDYRVIGGVVDPDGTTVGFTLFVDGHRVRHYRGGRLELFPLSPGRHVVQLDADGYVVGGGATVVVGELSRTP